MCTGTALGGRGRGGSGVADELADLEEEEGRREEAAEGGDCERYELFIWVEGVRGSAACGALICGDGGSATGGVEVVVGESESVDCVELGGGIGST